MEDDRNLTPSHQITAPQEPDESVSASAGALPISDGVAETLSSVGVGEERGAAPSSPPSLPSTDPPRGREDARGRWIGEDPPPWVGEESARWYITNWSGYRNYHCKWEGCRFAMVSGGVQAMEEHYRQHVIANSTATERIAVRRAGFVGADGRPL